MNVQDELQKIHHQYGTSEKANYEIQKLFDEQQERSYSDIEEAILLLKQTTEYEVLQSFRDKVSKLEQFKKK
jgi:hypothetical protein